MLLRSKILILFQERVLSDIHVSHFLVAQSACGPSSTPALPNSANAVLIPGGNQSPLEVRSFIKSLFFSSMPELCWNKIHRPQGRDLFPSDLFSKYNRELELWPHQNGLWPRDKRATKPTPDLQCLVENIWPCELELEVRVQFYYLLPSLQYSHLGGFSSTPLYLFIK